AGGGPGGEDGEGGHVAAVLGEEGPVGAGHRVAHQLRQLHHLVGGGGDADPQLHLLTGGGVHILVAVDQDIGTVGAHVVQEAVAVHVIEVAPLRVIGELGEGADGDEAALSRPLVAVDPAGNMPGGPLEQLVVFGISIRIHLPASSFT